METKAIITFVLLALTTIILIMYFLFPKKLASLRNKFEGKKYISIENQKMEMQVHDQLNIPYITIPRKGFSDECAGSIATTDGMIAIYDKNFRYVDLINRYALVPKDPQKFWIDRNYNEWIVVDDNKLKEYTDTIAGYRALMYKYKALWEDEYENSKKIMNREVERQQHLRQALYSRNWSMVESAMGNTYNRGGMNMQPPEDGG